MRLAKHDRPVWCVVVADDDSDWRTLMTYSLRRGGYLVAEACDGDELVARCQALDAAGEHQLIVVSDIEMPGCSGLEAAADLRSRHIDAPVLLVTGTQSSSLLDAAQNTGIRAVLYKPVSGDRLVAMVDRIRDGA